jgi:hypothetical protein
LPKIDEKKNARLNITAHPANAPIAYTRASSSGKLLETSGETRTITRAGTTVSASSWQSPAAARAARSRSRDTGSDSVNSRAAAACDSSPPVPMMAANSPASCAPSWRNHCDQT